LQRNLPATPIYDLVIHGDDLAVATHGRSFWVLDDITPLRQMKEQTFQESFHMFQPATAYRVIRVEPPQGASPLVGANPPEGVAIDYYLKEAPQEPIKLEIRDAQRKLVRSFTRPRPAETPAGSGENQEPGKVILPGKPGVNRFYWDLNTSGETPTGDEEEESFGVRALALPGPYKVELTIGKQTQTQPLEIKPDPRLQLTPADLKTAGEWENRLGEQLSIARRAVREMKSLDTQLSALEARLKNDPAAKEVVAAAEALDKKTMAAMESVTGWKVKPHRYSLNYPPALDDLLGMLWYTYSSSQAPPNQPAFAVLGELTKQLDAALASWREIKQKSLPAFNDLARKNKMPAVSPPEGSHENR
jgi:hypothetical protein